MSDIPNEKRKYPRVPVELVSVVRKVEKQGLGTPGESRAKNVSQKGFFIETSEPFEVGNIVAIEMKLPSHMDNAFLVGIVRWLKQDPPAGIGVEIVRTSDSEKFL